jgi:hypothetical protein
MYYYSATSCGNISGLFVLAVVLQLLFLIVAIFLLRYFYNESIPKMSEQHKPIELKDAMYLAGFLWIAGLFFNLSAQRIRS